MTDDPRSIDEFRYGTSRKYKEELNRFLINRGLTLQVVNGQVCLMRREFVDGFKRPPAQTKKCSEPSCRSSYKIDWHDMVEAHKQGWFMQRNGASWCPEHVPDWVQEWREAKLKESSDGIS